MIRVNKDFVIDVDDSNYIVKQDRHKTRMNREKDGIENVFTTCGYYGSLEGALEGVRKEMIRVELTGSDKTLAEAIAVIKAANTELNKNIKKVIGGI